MKYIGFTKSPVTSTLKKVFWLLIGVVFITTLLFSGNYLYKKKIQRDYQNQIRDNQNQMVEAVRKGDIVVDREYHHWLFKEAKARPYNSLEIELFVHNKGTITVTGNLVFKSEIDNKGLEDDWIDVVIETLLKDGYTMEQIQDEEFSNASHITKAITHYVKRGKKLPPGIDSEPVENPNKKNLYTFSFRKQILLKPGEVQRIMYKPDIPYGEAGYLLKTVVGGIEFN